jgi:hypothetical protein
MEESQDIDESLKDDAYYESLIPQLYRPVKKETEKAAPEPDFVVEPAPEPEPPVIEVETKPQPTIGNKVRNWLSNIITETEE